MPSLRAPLPLKVLLSYLAVLAAGAVPALLYVEFGFDDRLLRSEAEARATQAREMAQALSTVASDQVRDRLLTLAPACGCRITAMRLDGEVFYDSAVPEAATLPMKSRPEVRQVLDDENPRGRLHPGDEDLGVARRTSVTLGDEFLYVAVRVRAPKGSSPWILRLAVDTRAALALQRATSTYLRNAMAVSVSVALLFTLIAAFVFVRPLRRLRKTAEALADGDFTATSQRLTDDEIGDVAQALSALGTELRRKMAAAG